MDNKINPNKAMENPDRRSRLQKTRPTIGLLLEHTLDLENGYLPSLLAGVNASACERDINLLCFSGGVLQGSPLRAFDEQRNILYDLVSPENVDGLIILSTLGHFIPQKEFQEFHNKFRSMPTVSVSAIVPGTPSVLVDNEKGLREALNHLIQSHDVQRLAFICGPEDSEEAQIRFRVYKEVLTQYDLAYDAELVTPGNFRTSSGRNAIRLLLDQRQVNFEAVVAANDMMALGALAELQARGIGVPSEIALVGFDDLLPARAATPSLTTVRQPIFEMGRQALQILLRQLAGETVPERTKFPSELVIRRSCGCPSPVASQSYRQPVRNASKELGQRLRAQRQIILAEFAQALELIKPSLADGMSQLLDNFYDDVIGVTEGEFLSTLDSFLQQTVSKGSDADVWRKVVLILHRHIKPHLGSDGASIRAESILQQAQVLISEEGMKAQIKHNLKLERQTMALNNISQRLITTFDMEKLIDIIADSMPDLGIPSCYLALYEEPRPYTPPQPAPEWSRLVLACTEDGRVTLPAPGRLFRSQKLLPDGLFPQNKRITLMIEPLHFQDEQIGFALFERGPKEGNIYETPREHISSALKGAVLSQERKKTENALRRHRDHLDELVRERTTQLASANEQLRQEIRERQRVEMALRSSEENLQATLQSIGDAVMATDTQGRIMRMNSVAEKLTGWTLEEALGKPLNEIFNIINTQTKEPAVNPASRVLESGEIIGLANHTLLIAKNGAEYQIADSAAPIRNDDEEITGVVLVFRDVTEEYRMQKALRESETHLRTLIETIPDLIWLKDPDGVFLACNTKFERLFGAKESEIVGKTDYDFVDKELADHYRHKDLEAIAAGKPIVHEEEVAYADDGQRELIETVKSPMYDSEGKLIGVLGIARDITERKQTERELSESKKILSDVLNTIPVRVFWKDLECIYLGCNRLFAEDAGKNDPEEIIGQNDYDMGWVDQAELYRNDDKFVMESGQSKINYEEPQTTPEGELIWLNTSKIPLRDSNGEIYGVLGTYEDITERKRAEEDLRRSQRNLAYAQNVAKLGYYYWYLQTNEVSWSDEMYHIFGVSKSDYVPAVETFSQFLHPDDLHVLSEENFAKNISQETHQMEFRIFEASSGALKHLYLWAETTFADDGTPIIIFGIIQDITERREAEIQLEAYTAELERSNRELEEFAYVASHDLQEPLRKIQTFGDRLQQKYQSLLDEKGKDYVDRMQNAAARMQALIVDLLAFSRVRTHSQTFAKVDLHQTVRRVLHDLEIKITEAGAEIEVGDLPIIEADALQMEQLFQNLLSNALKFRRSDVPLKISVHCRIVDMVCEISIIDNGIGFDEKYLDRIFLVFERLHGRDEYPGTGVGLAICRRIVERHHGSIQASSKSGEGSTFIARLPISQQ